MVINDDTFASTFKCVNNVWGRMWDALKETVYCLNFQWFFDDGSERPDNCASRHPCHTNECYIECSAILRILLRCSCYSHTRYSAIFCTMTVVSSFLKWRLVLFLIFQLEVSFIRKFFKRLIKWSEKYCCASYQGLILWFWEFSCNEKCCRLFETTFWNICNCCTQVGLFLLLSSFWRIP